MLLPRFPPGWLAQAAKEIRRELIERGAIVPQYENFKTWVRVVSGPHAGKVALIVGTLSARERLMRLGLRSTYICHGGDLHRVDLSDLHEMTEAEQILAGVCHARTDDGKTGA